MAIGTDEFDEFGESIDYIDDSQYEDDDDTLDVQEENPEQDVDEEDPIANEEDTDYIDEFLKFHGIQDKSKIIYENEEGQQEEVDWNSLPKEDKINILKELTQGDPSEGLDQSEIELINTIRKSKMTPSEYIQYIETNGVKRYMDNNSQIDYSIDQYTDDELFMYDLIARMPDLTDEEVEQALEVEKTNEALFTKKIEALRNNYRFSEQEQLKQIELEKQQAAQEQYNQFSASIQDQINNFTDFYGCEISMDQDEIEDLYEFITGFDDAGNNHFAKVLNDPTQVVKMAWAVLKGEDFVNDLNNYYKDQIAQVRKNSYEKGLTDAKSTNKSESKFVIKKTDTKFDRDYIESDEF